MHRTRKIIGFAGLVIALFMGTLDATIVNIALPNIMNDLDASMTDASWIGTIYMLAIAIFIITVSKIADIFGRRKVMLFGVVLFGGFSFACMTAKTLGLLVFFRFFQGIGGAILTPVVIPMGIELFGKENISRTTAVMGACTALAAASGPAIGGFIIDVSSYHWIFGINVPLSVISFLAILIGTKESFDTTIDRHIDFIGTFFLTIMMGCLTFGMLKGNDYGWTSPAIIGCLSVSLVSLILFILTERKVKAPIVELYLFREITFTTSSLIYMVFGFAIVGPSLIMSYFLQNVRGFEPLHAAVLILPVSLAVAVGMPLATRLFDLISSRFLIAFGLIVAASGIFMLSMVRVSTQTSFIVCGNIITGFGMGFAAMSVTSAIKYIPESKSGIGSGIVNAARYVGQCIGMAVLVTLLNQNVITAKDNIRKTADHEINTHVLSPDVRRTAGREIDRTFAEKGSTKNLSKNRTMMKNIRKAAGKTANLPEPAGKTTWSKMYAASRKLGAASQDIALGMNVMSKAAEKIPPVSGKLLELGNASSEISRSQERLCTAIKLAAQREELTKVIRKIKDTKNDELSHAFSNVFLVCSLIILACTPFAAGTDRKR